MTADTMNKPEAMPGTPAEAQLPTFAEALRVWWRIGLLSFGGPAGQIALLHHEVVDQRRLGSACHSHSRSCSPWWCSTSPSTSST